MSMPAYSDETVRLVDIFAKQIELQGQLGVITEQLKSIPDHEARIRALESRVPGDLQVTLGALQKWRYGLPIATLISAGSLALAAYGWLHR